MSNSNWRRVTKRRRCPVCQHDSWCVYVGRDDMPEAVLCQRVESLRRIGEAGWLHRLRDGVTEWPLWERTIRFAVRLAIEAPGGPHLTGMAERWRLPEESRQLRRLADDLRLSSLGLYRLRAGWSPDRRCWAFPMSDADGRIVGMRLRQPGGRKLSIKGGREGLFVPEGLDFGGHLLVSEGPTDTAALLDLGFGAVGRPSCTGGVRHVVDLVRRLAVSEAVIVSDADAPGQRGAESLAAVLVAYCPAVRVIVPPAGIKDAREWKRCGATAADVQAAIDAAPVRRLAVNVRKAGANDGR